MLTTYTCSNGSCVPVTPATTCPGVIAGADAHTTRIYLRSLDLIDLVAHVIAGLPPGYAFLADQIRRSADSLPSELWLPAPASVSRQKEASLIPAADQSE